jgi:hypothetical protein
MQVLKRNESECDSNATYAATSGYVSQAMNGYVFLFAIPSTSTFNLKVGGKIEEGLIIAWRGKV